MVIRFFCCLFSVCFSIVGLWLLSMWCWEWIADQTSAREATKAMTAGHQPLVAVIHKPYVDISKVIGIDESCLVSCFPDDGKFKVSLYACSNEVVFAARGLTCVFRNQTWGTCTNVVAVQYGESCRRGTMSGASRKVTSVSSSGQTWTRSFHPGGDK